MRPKTGGMVVPTTEIQKWGTVPACSLESKDRQKSPGRPNQSYGFKGNQVQRILILLFLLCQLLLLNMLFNILTQSTATISNCYAFYINL